MSTSSTPQPKSTLQNVLSFLPLFSLIAPIMQGIQQIHGDAVAGATKKQLAMESLGLATATAQATLPAALQPEAAAASAAASKMIDIFAEFFNSSNLWGKTPAVITSVVANHVPEETSGAD